ncbi:MAG: conjugal transfer protein TraF [bacterium]
MKYKNIIAVFSCLCFAVSLYAKTEEPFMIRDLRPLAMGGAFTAVGDDANTLFYNPAGVATAKKTHLTLMQIGITIGDDLKDGYDWYKDNKDDIDRMDELKDSLDPDDNAKWEQLMNEVVDKISKLRIFTEINFPQFSVVSPHKSLSYGFGVFTNASVLADINSGILIPTIDLQVRVDGVLPIAFAMRFLNDRLAVGISPKVLMRGRMDEKRLTFLEMEDYDPVIQQGKGYGWDIGSIYKLTDNMNVGLAVKDFGGTKITYADEWDNEYSTTTPKAAGYTGMIHPQMNAGFSYRPFKLLLLSADINDILHSKDNVVWSTRIFPKIHAGCEVNLLSILRLRAGINQGYPTYGFDINLFLFHLEYARWADELGIYAGDIPDWKHKVALTMKYSWGGPKKAEEEKEPEPEPAPEPKITALPESERTNVAITDFESRAPLSQSEAAFISDFIRSDVVKTERFNVVEKNNMDKLLAEQGFQGTGCSSSDCAVQIGKILNVKTMVVGSCGKLLSKYVVTLNAVEVETSKIVYSDNISVDSSDELRQSVTKMVERFALAWPAPVKTETEPPAKTEPETPVKTGPKP